MLENNFTLKLSKPFSKINSSEINYKHRKTLNLTLKKQLKFY